MLWHLELTCFYQHKSINLTYMKHFDQINDKILQILMHNGRISNSELAERVGMSPSTCLRRVQELERRGIIKGYRAVLDRERQGIGFVAYIAVGLSEHSKTAQAAFERSISHSPEVRECHNITGAVEYLLRVEVSNINAYKNFHTNVLGNLPHVTAITSYIVMASPKDERA